MEDTEYLQIAGIKVLVGVIGRPPTPPVIIPNVQIEKPLELTVVQCQNNQLQFGCGNNGDINIVSASYGRSDLSTCAYANFQNTNCHFNAKHRLISRYLKIHVCFTILILYFDLQL